MEYFDLGFDASVFPAAQVVLQHFISFFLDELEQTIEIKCKHQFADAILRSRIDYFIMVYMASLFSHC